MIAIGFKYLILIEGKIYLIEIKMIRCLVCLCFLKYLCAKMMISLHLQLQNL